MQVLVVRDGGSGQGGRGRWRERSGPLRSCILDFRLSIPQGRGGVEGTCPLAPVCPWGKVHPGFNPWLLHVCGCHSLPGDASRDAQVAGESGAGAVTSCSSVWSRLEHRDWEQIQMSPGGSGEAPGPSLFSVSMVPAPSFPHRLSWKRAKH